MFLLFTNELAEVLDHVGVKSKLLKCIKVHCCDFPLDYWNVRSQNVSRITNKYRDKFIKILLFQ